MTLPLFFAVAKRGMKFFVSETIEKSILLSLRRRDIHPKKLGSFISNLRRDCRVRHRGLAVTFF
jgi:hypothetical protein